MNALILMTRIPYLNLTKTRLMPAFSASQCVALHHRFLRDYQTLFNRLSANSDSFVAYAPERANAARVAALPVMGEYFMQRGDDLGARMHHAFTEVFAKGYRRIVLVGADIPHLQPAVIRQAFKALDDADMVLGPTCDGGYYLIGLRQMKSAFFDNRLKWGGQSVLEATLAIADQLNWRVTLVDKYRDIDTVEDIHFFIKRFDNTQLAVEHYPEHTCCYLREIMEEKDNARIFK